MRAWQFHEFGGIEKLQLETVTLPEPGPGDAVVALEYAALNPADRYMIAGQYPRPAPRPFAVGRDGAGTIHTATENSRFRPGDPVVILGGDVGVSRPGTLAEYVAVPEGFLAPLPAGWSAAEGAATPLVGLTAWQALVDRGGLQAGETLLITGASGGVGTAAVVLARARGARVVALSRSRENRSRLVDLGADIVLDADPDGLVDRLKSALGGGRVDLALDLLGGPYLDLCARAVRAEGRILVVGLLSGLQSTVTVGLLIHKCLTIRGLSVSSYGPEAAQAAWAGLVSALEDSGRRIPIGSCHAFTAVPAAFAQLEGGAFGKICIKLDSGK